MYTQCYPELFHTGWNGFGDRDRRFDRDSKSRDGSEAVEEQAGRTNSFRRDLHIHPSAKRPIATTKESTLTHTAPATGRN